MSPIQLSEVELSSRGEVIRQLLIPISKVMGGPAYKVIGRSAEYLIGVHEGSPTMAHPRDWRFSLCVPNYRACYFEQWSRVGDRRREYWALGRAYLNMFKTISAQKQEEIEFLCLHCDPCEPEGAAHCAYKRGPHLHISIAEDPLPSAHIALAVGYLNQVLTSIDSLTESWKAAVIMLREEILDAIPH